MVGRDGGCADVRCRTTSRHAQVLVAHTTKERVVSVVRSDGVVGRGGRRGLARDGRGAGVGGPAWGRLFGGARGLISQTHRRRRYNLGRRRARGGGWGLCYDGGG